MVHALAGLNPTLPRRIGRVGLGTPIRGSRIPEGKRDPKFLPQSPDVSSPNSMWIITPAARCFSSGAASVARGGIRKSQRNQSFKRYATDMRRKDLKGNGSLKAINPQEYDVS